MTTSESYSESYSESERSIIPHERVFALSPLRCVVDTFDKVGIDDDNRFFCGCELLYKLSKTEDAVSTLFLPHPDLIQRTKAAIDGVVETPTNTDALKIANLLINNYTEAVRLLHAEQRLEDSARLLQAAESKMSSQKQELAASKKEITTLKRQVTVLKKKQPSTSAEFKEAEERARHYSTHRSRPNPACSSRSSRPSQNRSALDDHKNGLPICLFVLKKAFTKKRGVLFGLRRWLACAPVLPNSKSSRVTSRASCVGVAPSRWLNRRNF